MQTNMAEMYDEIEEEEAWLKQQLSSFQTEMIRLGSVWGFQYFMMYMRGKEELLFHVLNEPQSEYPETIHSSSPKPDSLPAHRFSFSAHHLPYDIQSLLLSQRTQKCLSGYAHIDVGLPPASPSEHETLQTDSESTLFLLGAYNRYNQPYVWVRTNHDRLVQLKGMTEEKDHPLKLHSCTKWREKDIKPWDIIGEVIRLCTYPRPHNPFDVDHNYFTNLPLNERIVATGAMIAILQKIIVHETEEKYYLAKVSEDLSRLMTLHLTDMHSIAEKQKQTANEMLLQRRQSNISHNYNNIRLHGKGNQSNRQNSKMSSGYQISRQQSQERSPPTSPLTSEPTEQSYNNQRRKSSIVDIPPLMGGKDAYSSNAFPANNFPDRIAENASQPSVNSHSYCYNESENTNYSLSSRRNSSYGNNW